jgi:molybdopterin molybdotransferase
MHSVEDARAIMLASVVVQQSERAPLAAGLARVLAAPLYAARDNPPFRASAMDGFALRAANTPGRLVIVGEARAGRPYDCDLKPGEAVRISTGAPLPAGADCILVQEQAAMEAGQLAAPALAAGKFVRDRGGDFHAGELLMPAGVRLSAAALGLAGAAGHAELGVTLRPRIRCLSIGDELVAAGGAPDAAQIFDSAAPAIAALAQAWGAEAATAPPLPDSPDRLASALADAAADAECVVMIGGASVGPHDHAPGAAAALGYELLVKGVSVRPGKPTWFARRGQHLILGLPGNPASALVCARLFLAPLIAAMLGQPQSVWKAPRWARLAAPSMANGAREHYARAVIAADTDGALMAALAPDQDSSLFSVFARSNALVRFTANAPAMPAGARAEFLTLTPD